MGLKGVCRGMFVTRAQTKPSAWIIITVCLKISPCISCCEMHKEVLWPFAAEICVFSRPNLSQNSYAVSIYLFAGAGYGVWL